LQAKNRLETAFFFPLAFACSISFQHALSVIAAEMLLNEHLPGLTGNQRTKTKWKLYMLQKYTRPRKQPKKLAWSLDYLR
jgi:hypothetical protein